MAQRLGIERTSRRNARVNARSLATLQGAASPGTRGHTFALSGAKMDTTSEDSGRLLKAPEDTARCGTGGIRILDARGGVRRLARRTRGPRRRGPGRQSRERGVPGPHAPGHGYADRPALRGHLAPRRSGRRARAPQRPRAPAPACPSRTTRWRQPAGFRRFSVRVRRVPWRRGLAVFLSVWETSDVWERRGSRRRGGRDRAPSRRRARRGHRRDRGRARHLRPARRDRAHERDRGAATPSRPGSTSRRARGSPAAPDLHARGPSPALARRRRREGARRRHRPRPPPARGGPARRIALGPRERGPRARRRPAVAGAVLTFSDESGLREHRGGARRPRADDQPRPRTPLNAVYNHAHLLLRRPDDAAKVDERAVSRAKSCERMRSMIQDLVEATLLEAGQLRLDRALDLAAVVPELLERFRGGARRRPREARRSSRPCRAVLADPAAARADRREPPLERPQVLAGAGRRRARARVRVRTASQSW